MWVKQTKKTRLLLKVEWDNVYTILHEHKVVYELICAYHFFLIKLKNLIGI